MKLKSWGVFFAPLRLGVALLLFVAAKPARAQHEFYENEGIGGIIRLIQRADCGVRVLMVAAHPDDEDSALIAYLSRGRGARVTYMSLTRGEGGQNSIGPEQGAELGLLRTAELLAARKIDGADQLFGREIDFGFSKTPEECFEKWGKENVVVDIVAAIQKTQPHIVIACFQGTPADGHGQHQASAIAAREAFARCQANGYGSPQKFYSGSFNDAPNVTLRIDTSLYDPIAGRSCAALGFHGRSQHRSQDMGMVEYEVSPRTSHLILEKTPEGSPVPEKDIFDGLKLERGQKPDLQAVLNTPGAWSNPTLLFDPILSAQGSWVVVQPYKVPHKEDELTLADVEPTTVEALEVARAMALGIRLTAFSEKMWLVPGEQAVIQCTAFAPAGVQLDGVRWSFVSYWAGRLQGTRMWADGMAAQLKSVPVPPSELTTPHYLADQPTHGLYVWPKDSLAGLPFGRPAFIIDFEASYRGHKFHLRIPAEYRAANPTFGEVREDLAIVPGVSVDCATPLSLVNLAKPDTLNGFALTMILHNRGSEAFRGSLRLNDVNSRDALPGIVAEVGPGESKMLAVPVPVPLAKTAVNYAPFICATEEKVWERGYHVRRMAYEHIRPQTSCLPTEVAIRSERIEIPSALRVAYIPGPQDDVAPALKQLGVDITVLSASEAVAADLSKYSSVVLGARAYEAHPELAANNEHFFDYARAGGTLVVQYNKYPFAEKNLAPYPITFSLPHDRVTDEDATVTLLKPEHPAFHFPNEITQDDFRGWVQERGLYFWASWGDHYTPLLSCADKGEPQKAGGLLIAPLGKGQYVYTGLAFFRQIPAGVEGATQLFVNLLSLGLAPGEGKAP